MVNGFHLLRCTNNSVHFPYRFTSLLNCDVRLQFRDYPSPAVNLFFFFRTFANIERGGQTLKFNNPFSAEPLGYKIDFFSYLFRV